MWVTLHANKFCGGNRMLRLIMMKNAWKGFEYYEKPLGSYCWVGFICGVKADISVSRYLYFVPKSCDHIIITFMGPMSDCLTSEIPGNCPWPLQYIAGSSFQNSFHICPLYPVVKYPLYPSNYHRTNAVQDRLVLEETWLLTCPEIIPLLHPQRRHPPLRSP